MNKSEFIRAYADNLGITIKDAETYFNAFIDTMTDSLQKGEYIHISGFATFDLKEKAARDGVNPLTGEFNFAVMEGYMIRGGKICEPVRGATLIGKGYEVLLNIDMVGDDLVLGQGMCGSISGSVQTNVGQPMIRISEITVGGEI